MNVGYKVVRKINDSEYGPVTSYAHQGIRYVLNQSTLQDKDKFGPMTLFNSLLLAQQFANDMSHLPGLIVFKIQYSKSDETSLWKKETKKKLTKELANCPFGTILADSVMLEEELK
jgi:hypothetical protein